jgi:hypothetical protein
MRLSWRDAITVVSILLGIVGMLADDTRIMACCFVLAAVVISFAVLRHKEISLAARVGITALACLLFAGAGYMIAARNRAKELRSNIGILYPGDKPSPQSSCNATPRSKHDLGVYLGTNTAFVENLYPYTVLEVGGYAMLRIDKTDDGGLRIAELHIFDDRGDQIVDIEGPDRYWVNPGVIVSRPSRDTPQVRDHANRKVLDLIFLNDHALSVEGIFRRPNNPTVTITADVIFLGGIPYMSGSCAVGGCGALSIGVHGEMISPLFGVNQCSAAPG